MPTVFVPPLLRRLTSNRDIVSVEGVTVREVINNLEAGYPGIKDRICEGDRIRPTIAVAVDGQISNQGMRRPVGAESEVHFLPAIGGGSGGHFLVARFPRQKSELSCFYERKDIIIEDNERIDV